MVNIVPFERKRPTEMIVPACLVLVFLIVALEALPASIDAENALLPSLIAMSLAVLAYPIYRVFARGPRELLRCDVAVLIGLAYLTYGDTVQPGYVFPLERGVLIQCYLADAFFVVSFIIGSHLFYIRRPRFLARLASADYSLFELMGMSAFAFVVGMFNFMLFSNFSLSTMIAGLQAARFDAPWTRGSLGGWNAFASFLVNFGLLLPTFTVFLAIKARNWLNWRVLIAAVSSGIFLLFVAQGGGRRYLGVFIGAALITWLLAADVRLRFRHMAMGLLVLSTLLVGMEYMMNFRVHGFGASEDVVTGIDRIRVDENLTSLGNLVSAIPSEHEYVTWRYFLYGVALPLPRVFWSGKPVDPGFALGPYLTGDPDGVNYTTTSVGEFYMAFGFIGILIGGLLVGTLANSWESVLINEKAASAAGLYGIGVMVQVAGCRSTYELELMSYSIVCWFGLNKLLNIFRRVSPAQYQPREAISRSSPHAVR